MAVLGNVVILNFTYDVPVKIYSANLLLMAIFLAAPDMPRIFNLVVRHRRTEPAEIKPLYATPAMHRASLVFRSLLVAYAVFGNVASGHARFVSSGPDAPKPPLFGIYDVQSMTRNGQAVPLVITDASIWKRVVFSQFDRASMRSMTDSLTRYSVQVDTTAKTVLLTGRFDTTVKMKLSYTRASNGQLVLSGRVAGDSIVATFKRIDEKKYLLMSRRFNWIQEQPFNR
ncbi:MAG: putative rane protein [Gemmatimonadetes bacterium]|nr:putative rane protein [Gemmatimonadota bacterium]